MADPQSPTPGTTPPSTPPKPKGLGVPTLNAGPPAASTAVGSAPGALLFDTVNKVLYRNAGTASVPRWVRAGMGG